MRLFIFGVILVMLWFFVTIGLHSGIKNGGWLRERVDRLRNPQVKRGALGSSHFCTMREYKRFRREDTEGLSLLGAFWGLFLTGTSMDLMAGIGLVVLVGVVVANGIVLVDRIDQARAEGMTREAAIDDACRSRLRPILMTALTTILGLIPMAVGSSDFIGIPYAPLGRCVMGGMIASTVLTLIYLPFLYTVLDDLAIWARGWWGVVMGRTA